MASLTDKQVRVLAEAFAESQRPKEPERFDYSATKAIVRANDGSVADGRALLALAVAMLRQRGPAPTLDAVTILPAWMADYLALCLDAASKSKSKKGAADAALNISQKKRGRNQYANEHRDAWLAYVAAETERLGGVQPRMRKLKGEESPQERTAKQLGVSPRTLRRKIPAKK